MGLFELLVGRVFKVLGIETEEQDTSFRLGRKKRDYLRISDLLKNMSVAKIPGMIDWLESPSQTLRNNAYLSLSLFTGHDLGNSSKRWRDWYEVNRGRPPHEWWADRLGQRGYNTYGMELDRQIPVVFKAMEDPDPLVRRTAGRLLGHLSGIDVRFTPDGSEKLRRRQIEKWQAYYERVKRLRQKQSKGGDS